MDSLGENEIENEEQLLYKYCQLVILYFHAIHTYYHLKAKLILQVSE